MSKVETEAKFIVSDESTFARLQDAERFGPYTRQAAKTKVVHDRYLDTVGRDLYRGQFFARLREGKEDGTRLLTLKSVGGQPEGAIHVRDEYETEVSGLDISTWPEGDVRRIVKKFAGDQTLSDLFVLDQTRTISILRDHDRDVAELSLDLVTIEGPDGPVRSYELEVELLPDGTIADLAMLSRQLIDDYGLAPQTLSKFEQAMRLLLPNGSILSVASPTPPLGVGSPEPANLVLPTSGGPEQGDRSPAHTGALEASETLNAGKAIERRGGKKHVAGIEATDSISQAARKLIRVQFEAMLDNEAGTRVGEDPEALHDMRVATRRMRAIFRVLGLYLDSPSKSKVQKDVRRVARSLGGVRDMDVLIEHAQQFQAGLPGDQQADLDGLLGNWEGKREQARKKMLRQLDSGHYRQLQKGVEAFLKEKDNPSKQHSEVQPQQVRHLAGSAIWSRYEAVRAFETVMDQPRLWHLHALRITAKYLRYTLEFFSEVLPADTRNLIRDIVSTQDQLGALHDAEVASMLIQDYLERSAKQKKKKQSSERPAGLLSYLTERENAVNAIQAEFGPMWEKIGSSDWRLRLAAVIAAL